MDKYDAEKKLKGFGPVFHLVSLLKGHEHILMALQRMSLDYPAVFHVLSDMIASHHLFLIRQNDLDAFMSLLDTQDDFVNQHLLKCMQGENHTPYEQLIFLRVFLSEYFRLSSHHGSLNQESLHKKREQAIEKAKHRLMLLKSDTGAKARDAHRTISRQESEQEKAVKQDIRAAVILREPYLEQTPAYLNRLVDTIFKLSKQGHLFDDRVDHEVWSLQKSFPVVDGMFAPSYLPREEQQKKLNEFFNNPGRDILKTAMDMGLKYADRYAPMLRSYLRDHTQSTEHPSLDALVQHLYQEMSKYSTALQSIDSPAGFSLQVKIKDALRQGLLNRLFSYHFSLSPGISVHVPKHVSPTHIKRTVGFLKIMAEAVALNGQSEQATQDPMHVIIGSQGIDGMHGEVRNYSGYRHSSDGAAGVTGFKTQVGQEKNAVLYTQNNPDTAVHELAHMYDFRNFIHISENPQDPNAKKIPLIDWVEQHFVYDSKYRRHGHWKDNFATQSVTGYGQTNPREFIAESVMDYVCYGGIRLKRKCPLLYRALQEYFKSVQHKIDQESTQHLERFVDLDRLSTKRKNYINHLSQVEKKLFFETFSSDIIPDTTRRFEDAIDYLIALKEKFPKEYSLVLNGFLDNPKITGVFNFKRSPLELLPWQIKALTQLLQSRPSLSKYDLTVSCVFSQANESTAHFWIHMSNEEFEKIPKFKSEINDELELEFKKQWYEGSTEKKERLSMLLAYVNAQIEKSDFDSYIRARAQLETLLAKHPNPTELAPLLSE